MGQKVRIVTTQVGSSRHSQPPVDLTTPTRGEPTWERS